AATIVAYLPAMQGGILWDDDAHITREDLRSADGLRRIWFELGATQQYYPLLHSAFWAEHKIWGDSLLGYHLTNVLLHATAASLVYAVVRKLQIPGALLIALVFAVHPVHVESVAWITEQKNTLSAVFYLAAMWSYLKFDDQRQPRFYWLALALFVLGLLTKTVTATLPAALMVIFWWQRGTLSWRRDVLPLVPHFALGAVAGLFTAWVERKLIGAEGAAFEMSLVERGLLAGRVPWFYLSKLVWPWDLMFVYPRWQIDAAQWWQWLYPAATIGLLVLLWSLRRRWRSPLAAWLFFVGTLFPALGFLNVYPFQFSFVADHFQYLASLGVIVFAVGLSARWADDLPQTARGLARVVAAIVVVALAALTWQQASLYADRITLYEATLAKNPNSWMVLNNLGNAYTSAGRADEAIDLYRRALTAWPDFKDAHANLGIALKAVGRNEEALAELREAVRLQPDSTSARYNLGYTLATVGQIDEGIEQIREVVRLKPEAYRIRNNLGVMLFTARRYPEAIAEFEKVLEIQPDFAEARENLNRARQASVLPQKAE
ncbi:MAG: tetratricopeptide repeat protein, partial [Pirellulales bacterium]